MFWKTLRESAFCAQGIRSQFQEWLGDARIVSSGDLAGVVEGTAATGSLYGTAFRGRRRRLAGHDVHYLRGSAVSSNFVCLRRRIRRLENAFFDDERICGGSVKRNAGASVSCGFVGLGSFFSS